MYAVGVAGTKRVIMSILLASHVIAQNHETYLDSRQQASLASVHSKAHAKLVSDVGAPHTKLVNVEVIPESHAPSVLLASGARVTTHATPVAQMQATVWYSATTQDNIVAAQPETEVHAKAVGAHSYLPAETLYMQSEPGSSYKELVTYWSEQLNDTLAIASPGPGVTWAEDPSNGYVKQRTEGYCIGVRPPAPAKGPQALTVVEYVQMWSDKRKDSFLVAVGSSHEHDALNAGYTRKWSECFAVVSAIPGATGKWTKWDDKPQQGIPWPKSKDMLGWEYLSGANPGYMQRDSSSQAPGQPGRRLTVRLSQVRRWRPHRHIGRHVVPVVGGRQHALHLVHRRDRDRRHHARAHGLGLWRARAKL